MEEALRGAVEKLNSDIRNHLTPILAYTDMLSCNAAAAERKKLAVIALCAENILSALDEFVGFVTDHKDA